MGGGDYSSKNRSSRLYSVATDKGFLDTEEYMASAGNVFEQKSINNAMNPEGIVVRESRDSDEHPESLAIIIALDVTGSMGSVPHALVKNGLPAIMESIIQAGIKDPQVLFLGIGDSNFDSAPLQVGQFESSDELLDKWLTSVYLEGGGGGNYGESYHLAWYFAARHTSIDCFEKRKQKGMLFTIGDEPVLDLLPEKHLKNIMGKGQYGDMTASELLVEAAKTYNTCHIHIRETYAGNNQETVDQWKQLIGSNLLIAEKHTDVANIIKAAIMSNMPVGGTNANTKSTKENEETEEQILL